MGNPQREKFRSVDEMLDSLPRVEWQIVNQLRGLVITALPDCREKLSYNVPFYYKRKSICFIWPASIPWGNLKEGVALGFVNGHLLDREGEHLKRDGRKAVGRMLFTHPAHIDTRLVQAYLYEADKLDAAFRRRKH